MALVDPNISLGVRPMELQDPLAQYGKMAAIQSAQNQNALAQYQLGAAQREEAAQNALSAAYQAAYDPNTGSYNINKLRQSLIQAGSGAKLPDVEKKLGELRTQQLTQQKTETELIDAKLKQSRQFLDAIDPANPEAPAQFWAWHKANHADPVLGPVLAARGVTADQSAARIDQAIQAGPAAFAQLIRQAQLGTEKFMELNKPHYITENLGGESRVSALPGLGGVPTVVSTSKRTATPDALMADARARERLNAEMATGTLTPESLDVAANVYLQTGQLPTGLGKAAAGLRAQVMNRATELSTGKPPADVAGDIVGAKIDVAARAKAVKDFSTGTQGRQVNAFNTAIDHLETMGQLSDALQNNDIKAINAVGNLVARQTGAPAPTNFDAAKQIVTAEVIKAVVASGGGVTERQEAERNFAAASSPAQLKGVIDTYKKLLGGQLNSLGLQYANTTGRKDFESKLTPAAKTEFQRIRGEQQPAGAPAAPTAIPQSAIDALKAGRGTDAQFDEIFGPGAAKRVRGGK